jgi:NADH dehydrogenase
MIMGNKNRVVILGGGFAGAYCAQVLEKITKNTETEIVLIDRNNYFIFYPLLVEAGTGSLEPRHAVVSIRKFLKRTIFRMAEATDINFKEKQISYKNYELFDEQVLLHDQLVLALGSVTFQMKSLTDAVALRDRAIQLLELADTTENLSKRQAMLHLVVVGSNFTGVEVAGEFDVFLKEASRYYKNVNASDCKITLIEIADRILLALDNELSNYAAQHLRRRGINIKLRTSISKINSDYVILDDGLKLPTHTVIWCAGIAPNPIVKKLPLPTDERGYILCERDLQVKGYNDVWAIGDCAVNVDPDGNPYPPTAQHAVGEAKHAAKNITGLIHGKEPTACKLLSKGALVPLGCRTAVAMVFGIKLSGFRAWFLWRTVYLLKMPGWAKRIRVALDWTMDLLFKRDYVQMGVHKLKMVEQTPSISE